MKATWDDVVRVAVLGTERQAPALSPADGVLGAALAETATREHEEALLGAVALLGAYRTAGQRHRLPHVVLTKCPPDEARPCNPRAASYLERMLGGEHRQVLPEWLEALGGAGRRLPLELLPTLLDLAADQRALRDAVIPVLGRRGLWLAAQNPRWRYAQGSLPETAAEALARYGTLPLEARVRLVRRWRGQEPAVARQLVESTWAEDSPEERAKLLAEYAVGLGPQDEPFLEELLGDRRKEVRLAAAGLLRRLPGSRLLARMAKRASSVLSISQGKKGLLGKLGIGGPKLEVTLPSECDKAMQRDGIAPKPPASEPKLGERAFWMRQVLGAVPPRRWSDGSGVGPAALVTAAARGEWAAPILQGWAEAAVLFEDGEWAEALLAEASADLVAGHRVSLLAVLPTAIREKLVTKLAASASSTSMDNYVLQQSLDAWTEPWSEGFARTMVQQCLRGLQAGGAAAYFYAEVLKQCGLKAPVTVAREAAEWCRRVPSENAAANAVDRFLAVLQFRVEMLAAIREE